MAIDDIIVPVDQNMDPNMSLSKDHDTETSEENPQNQIYFN
jgi:hypothetical protein